MQVKYTHDSCWMLFYYGLSVSLCPTQLDDMLIRLPSIIRIVQLPQTFEMYTPFNLLCLSGIVGWMTGKNCIVFPPLQQDAISLPLPWQCWRIKVYVYILLSQYMCYFRVLGPMWSAVGRMETGQGPSVCAHTAKATVLYLKTSIIAFSTLASEDMA